MENWEKRLLGFNVDCELDAIETMVIKREYESVFTDVKWPLQNIFDKSERTQLCIACCCLLLFVDINFLNKSVEVDLGLDQKEALEMLKVDGEEVYNLTKNPQLLVVCRSILLQDLNLTSLSWWRMRYARIHRHLLECNVPALLQLITDAQIDDVFFNLEKALALLEFKNDSSITYLDLAQKSTGFEYEVLGKMGKRTKFQQQSHANLCVFAKSKSKFDNIDANDEETIKECILNNDTLLDNVLLEGDLTGLTEPLEIIDQCILLCRVLHFKQHNPEEELSNEQVSAFLNRIIGTKSHNHVLQMAFIERCHIERNSTRKAIRAVEQLEKITKTKVRLDPIYFFCCSLPPKWGIYMEIAQMWLCMGSIKTALEIYMDLQLWEKVCFCYLVLNKKEKAEEILVDLLKKEKTTQLLCLLGDATRNPENYWEAWELSNQTYSRPMRSLGAHYFNQKEFKKSIECYYKSFEINPLFEDAWFACGCAALESQDNKVAIDCFTRCVALSMDHGKAWANLSTALRQQRKLKESFVAIQQAARYMNTSWQVWSNYILIALELEKIDESIEGTRCLSHLKPIPIDVLGPLVLLGQKASVNQLDRMEYVVNKAIEATTDPRLWKISCFFFKLKNNHQRALECAQRCFSYQMEKLESIDSFKCANDLWTAYNDHGPEIYKDWREKAILDLQNLISRVDLEQADRIRSLIK